jgi:predicted ATPase/class 3 adenylate cyclase
MTALPSGTVTFLFTDVEGSTRLWEERREAMRGALARHDEIVQDAIAGHGGHVVKTTGDGFHAVFASAHDAVGAALEAQFAVEHEGWPDAVRLRVRMGVHTGEAEQRAGDYYGSALNRAARLMGAAHGGQILVSGVTAALVGDELAEGVTIAALGEHRLRDLAAPIAVFQLRAPGLAEEFPVLRSLDAYPSNLPTELTSFVGRVDEVEQIAGALEEGRLITLTGVGGVGKTRLALQAAAQVLPRFADGVWVCELAVANDVDAMVQVMATALGVNPGPSVALDDAVVGFLRSREVLLVMDNCEHLLDPVGRFVDTILRSCTGVRVLATSREGLAINGERVVPLRSLGVPEVDTEPASIVVCDSVRLFEQRAAAARPTFAIDASNALAVGEICRRLDGVPLAIELAAARVQAMSAAEIARLLDERFRLLTGGRRSVVERHQTLRATVDWSYALLNESERKVFDCLGVFVGSFDAVAVTAVASVKQVEAWDVLDALAGLVAKSMVQAEETAEGTTRYSVLDTLRAYAREQLEDSGDIDQARRRHAEYFADLAQQIGVDIGSVMPRSSIAAFRVETDNMRAAVEWAVDSEVGGDIDSAVRIVASLGPAVITYSPWADKVLPRSERATPEQRALLLAAAAGAAADRGDREHALDLARAALNIGVADLLPLALVYMRIISSEAVLGRIDRALEAADEGLAVVSARGGDLNAEAMIRSSAATVLASVGDPHASAEATTAVQLARADGRHLVLSIVLNAYASVLAADDPEAARAAVEENMNRQRDGLESAGYGRTLALAVRLRVDAGDTANALPNLVEAIRFYQVRGYWAGAFSTALRVVLVLEALGHPHAAAEALGCAEAHPLGMVQTVDPLAERQALDAASARLRTTLGDADYGQILAECAALSPDDAIARVITLLEQLIARPQPAISD